MAKILLSIYPEYTKAIFSGMKTAEFRRKVVNELLEGGSHTLYFYETKKNGGAGKVVGQADVKEVFVTLHAEYLPSGLPQLDGLSVEKMQQMYITWCRQKEKPPVGWWYSDRDFTAYRKLIGWTGDPKHYYNYVLKLENVQKYNIPLDVSCFTYESGKTITRPPQNMCKCFKDVGAAYAEIAVNALIGLIAVLSAYGKGYLKFAMPGKDFLKDWCKIGAFAGIQIFLDNFIYAVMVCKMVNAVSESGNYWVANNFIWGWLLVPVTCLAEVIKKNDKVRLTMKNCWRYLIMIFAVWLITMPKWKSFISGPMASDGDVIIKIVLPLIPFYITYMISAVIDGWFVSHGRTIYNAINSLIVNVGYYGVIYFMFKRGMFAENMMFIIGMFGCGMLVHMVASILMYRLEVIRMQAMPADCQKKAV